MRWFALLLIFSVCTPLAAQDPIPDTTEAWRYFPLEVGNVWEYFVVVGPSGGFDYFSRRVIERDTLIENRRYFVSKGYKAFEGDASWTPQGESIVRFDSLTTRVMSWWGGGEELMVCNLNGPFMGEIDCFDDVNGPSGEPEDTFVSGGYGGTLTIGSDLVALEGFKSFWSLEPFDPSFYPQYAAPLGFIGFRPAFCGLCRSDLIYVRLDLEGIVVEYGSPLPVLNEYEAPLPSSGISLNVYPNPSRDWFFIGLSSSKPQQVVVEVFDLLGRRVYSEEHVVGTGETSLHLDGSDWPRGLYLVRVTTADGQVATARIARQ